MARCTPSDRYFFSTLLSVFNKKLIGRDDGLFNHGGFPGTPAANLPPTSPPLQRPCSLRACSLRCSTHWPGWYWARASSSAVPQTPARGKSTPAQVLLHLLSMQRVLTACSHTLPTVAPNGVSTGLDIGLSLVSLHFITLSFYTMCKATSPLFLLFFAILWGLERLNLSLLAIVGTITPGLALLVRCVFVQHWQRLVGCCSRAACARHSQVHGERKFDLAGFLLVMSASAMSGLRWTYTQVQLQGAHGGGFTGGPLEVLEQLTPVASMTVGLLSLLVEQPWNLPQSPYFQDLFHTGITFGIMAMGGMIAFLMVWAEFQVISFTSALTLMIAGTFKELVTGTRGCFCYLCRHVRVQCWRA